MVERFQNLWPEIQSELPAFKQTDSRPLNQYGDREPSLTNYDPSLTDKLADYISGASSYNKKAGAGMFQDQRLSAMPDEQARSVVNWLLGAHQYGNMPVSGAGMLAMGAGPAGWTMKAPTLINTGKNALTAAQSAKGVGPAAYNFLLGSPTAKIATGVSSLEALKNVEHQVRKDDPAMAAVHAIGMPLAAGASSLRAVPAVTDAVRKSMPEIKTALKGLGLGAGISAALFYPYEKDTVVKALTGNK